jgi:hypothetical protein
VNEKQITVEALEHVAQALEAINNHVVHMENFLMGNFRTYSNRYNNAHYHLSAVRGLTEELKKLTASNADNAHMLEQTEDPQPDGTIRWVQGDYPQNHSIQQANQRTSGYSQQQPTGYQPYSGAAF